jgi:dihydroorotase-like cyclic amidohydrolase
MEKLILTLLVAFTANVSADSLLLSGATVHTVTKGTLASADVLIRDGKIAEVSEKIEAKADRTVDLKGLHLFPGLISASTDLERRVSSRPRWSLGSP